MRILWHSNAPWAQTGYGNQTKNFVPRLAAAGHQMAYSSFYGLNGSILNVDGGIPCYPGGYEAYGNDVVLGHAEHFNADAVITLIDAWVMRPEITSKFRWIAYAPVDHEPVPPAVLRALKTAWKVVAYSRHGQAQLKKAGVNADYVPHGIETQVFKQGDRQAARERLGLPKDKFVVGMVAANKGYPSRKSFPEAMEAFARFYQHHKGQAVLYIHSEPHGVVQGINLPELREQINALVGLPGDAILYAEPYRLMMGAPTEQMIDLYNSFDVLLSPSTGEGFGIPIVEAQSCGCPVIVTDYTAMSELCFAGWRVEGQRFYDAQAAWSMIPNIGKLERALQSAWEMRGIESFRNKARAGALDYDADLVTSKYWLPLLAQYEGELPPTPAQKSNVLDELAAIPA